MAIDNVEEAKPNSKNVELDFLSKYKTDLNYLKNGKMTIERKMVEKGVDDETIDKKLRKLTKSIEKLENMIKEYEEEIEEDVDESDFDDEDDEN